MCRIAGFWDFTDSVYEKEDAICIMRDVMAAGGPDDAGKCLIQNGPVFGHRRLSILDLSD